MPGSGGGNGDFTCDDEVCERTTLLEEAVDELEDNAYDSLLEAKDAGIVIKQLKVQAAQLDLRLTAVKDQIHSAEFAAETLV